MRPTAKNMRNPTLRALGVLSNFQEMPCKGRLVEDKVLHEMGIQEEEYGYQPSTGKPLTRLWIQWAVRSLVKDNMIRREKKGWWALTGEGLKSALLLRGSEENEENEVNEDPKPDPKGSGKTSTESSVSLSFHLSGEDTYIDDPYLRSIGIANTPCFGKHSVQSPTCRDCPVAVSCRASMASVASSIAEILRSKNASTGSPPASNTEDLENILQELEDETKTSGNTESGTAMRAPVASICYSCNKEIQAGSQVIWNDNHGVRHLTC